MRKTLFGFAVVAGLAFAQAPADMIKTYTSSAEIEQLRAKAKADRKNDAPTVTEPILRLKPYNANLEYRPAVGPAAVHETEAEMFYVIDGSATLTTGGKLTEEKRTNAENLTGSGITGGSDQKVSKGDFIIVPEKTPHWFSKIDGSITLMSIHVPRK